MPQTERVRSGPVPLCSVPGTGLVAHARFALVARRWHQRTPHRLNNDRVMQHYSLQVRLRSSGAQSGAQYHVQLLVVIAVRTSHENRT